MDIDGDGKLDLVAGDTTGNVWFFRNVGTKTEPKLAAGVKLKSDGKEISGPVSTIDAITNVLTSTPAPDSGMGTYSKIHVTDWDGDGLLDILVGQSNSKSGADEIVWYRNTGNAKDPKFAALAKLDLLKGLNVSRPSPYVVDWDGDGKRDVLIGADDGKVYFVQNTGTNAKPVFAAPEEVKLPGMDSTNIRARIAVVDWNNRGKLDLLVGTYYYNAGADKKDSGGKIWLFARK